MGRMETMVAETEHQLSAEQRVEEPTAEPDKTPDRARSACYNSASSALDEDIAAAREITNSPNGSTPEKPIVSINGRDIDSQEIDKAA